MKKRFLALLLAGRFAVGSYGQICGTKVEEGATCYAQCCWSVDSIGSYNYYNQVIG